MVRFIPWSSQTKGTFPPPVYISHNHNLNHLSAYHVTSSRMSLGLRVYSSPLFFDPVSLLMAYQQTASFCAEILIPFLDMCAWVIREGKLERHNREMGLGRRHDGHGWMDG